MSGRKRKSVVVSDDDRDDGDYTAGTSSQPAEPKAKRARKNKADPPEKRLARYRGFCPQNISERVERVMSQRFYMVARSRNGEELREEFKVLGSTGNVYTVVVDKVPTCDCPDARKGNHCKHMLFVFLKVLGVPQISNLYFQKALLSSELAEIFAHAPVTAVPAALGAAYARATGAQPDAEEDTHEMRIEDGEDCGICFDSMDVNARATLTSCVTCRKAMHKDCFARWARTAPTLTCVYCRAPWPDAGPSSRGAAGHSAEGYLNLASAAGISTVRDTSSYYRGARRGQRAFYNYNYYDDDY